MFAKEKKKEFAAHQKRELTSKPFLAIHRSKTASTIDVSLLDVHTIVENSPTCDQTFFWKSSDVGLLLS